MREKVYNREIVIEYAAKWANSRNPKYYNYDKIGGDCTNFISQCIYAGCNTMNYKLWYYKNANDKSPSWTGVEFLYNFLVTNKSIGPSAIETNQKNLCIGDVIQLSFDGNIFGHSLIIVKIENNNYLSDILIATHTYDAYLRPVSTYDFKKIRFLHISDLVKY